MKPRVQLRAPSSASPQSAPRGGKKKTEGISPRVATRLATLVSSVRWDQTGGVATVGSTPIALRVVLPSLGSAPFTFPSCPLALSLFPMPSTQMAAEAQRALERMERKKQEGKELTAVDAAQMTILRAAVTLATQNPGNVFASLLTVYPTGRDAVDEALEIAQSARLFTPSSTWPQVLSGVFPVSPPVRIPYPSAYFALVPEFFSAIPVSPPPDDLDAAERQFYLGVSADGHMVLWSPWKSINPHLGITGYSGSGKSVLCRLIVYQAALQGVPLVVIDPKGEWPQQVPALEGLGVKVNAVLEQDIYRLRLPTLAEVLALLVGESSPGPQRAQALASLLEPLSKTASEVAIRVASDRGAVWADVYRAAEGLGCAGEYSLFDPNGAWGEVFNPDLPPWSLDARVSVFGLTQLTGAAVGDVKNNDFFVLLLLLSLTEALKRVRGAMVLVDEAHILLRLPSTRRAVDVLLRVARSAGLSVILASQTWADLYGGDEPLAAQCATRVILRPAAEEVERITEYKEEIETICAVGKPGAGLLITPKGRSLFSIIVPVPAQRFCFA